MLESKRGFEMHVRNLGYIVPLQIRGPKTTFSRRLHNFTATLTAYIFRMKQDIDNWQVQWQLRGVSYIVPKQHEL